MISTLEDPFYIVLVEDDAGHASLIKRNLKRAGVQNPTEHLVSGAAAMEYFFGADQPDRPYDRMLAVLDLNLPDIDGFEILRHLKANEATRRMPVVILTTTDAPRDIDRCYALGCNVFMTKPVGYDEFSEAIRKLGLMMTVVRVPHIHD
ncbi:MAG: response regulator [Asticcacaulis sp.]|nr:response regulator [Asticcacaulis sp.]